MLEHYQCSIPQSYEENIYHESLLNSCSSHLGSLGSDLGCLVERQYLKSLLLLARHRNVGRRRGQAPPGLSFLLPPDLNIVQRPFACSFHSGLFSQADDDIFICG